jgi:hypothetical protein
MVSSGWDNCPKLNCFAVKQAARTVGWLNQILYLNRTICSRLKLKPAAVMAGRIINFFREID